MRELLLPDSRWIRRRPAEPLPRARARSRRRHSCVFFPTRKDGEVKGQGQPESRLWDSVSGRRPRMSSFLLFISYRASPSHRDVHPGLHVKGRHGTVAVRPT